MKRVCLYLSAVLLLSVAALAQSAPPSADTYSNSSHADTGVNYGSAILLVVQTGGNNAYLQFNLKTVPTGATVSKATLRLFVDALVTSGSFDVYQLNKSWTETTLTYSNAPPLGISATGGHPVAVSQVNQFVLVDITSLVQGWQSGTIANNGIALAMTTSSGSFSFDSKESIFTAHQPELEIVLNAPAGATGPQGPQGPQGLTGSTGAIGPVGPIGPKGDTGAQGTQGPTGNTGATGPIGATGTAGNTGAAGPVGPIGPIGLTGNTGATGPVGPIGATGSTGALGPVGPIGPTGNTGATGPQGSPGAPGVQGATGNTGSTGPAGPIGFTGPQGPAGNDGAAGSNGTGFNFRNAFDSTATYAPYDVITYNGSTYDANAAITPGGANPDLNPSWTLMAQAGTNGANGTPGATGSQGPQGPQGPMGSAGAAGAAGPQGFPGVNGATGPAGPTGPQGATGDVNARMIFPSFYPGNLTGTWMGGQFTLDQAITVLRIAAVAKTVTGAACPAAVFRLTNGTKGQDLVLSPGQNWSDTGAMVMTFNAGDVLLASLRTGSTCATNTGADANLLVEYKMQATGDTDACAGTSCNGFCTTTTADPSNCGQCGTACPSGQACTNGACPGGCTGGQVFCSGACTNTQTDNNNCGGCGNLCKTGFSFCSAGACVPLLPNGGSCTSSSQCLGGNCTGGVCTTACAAGQVLCNGTCVNEQTDSNNCGACGVVCAGCGPGLTACLGSDVCQNGGCQNTLVCANTQSDPNNCGACGKVCLTNNDTPACQAGSCGIQSCNPGFADCDRNPANGCEVNLNNSVLNCGACGNVCVSGQTCSNGACAGQPLGGACSSNAACASNICDFVSSTCVSNFCVDQRKDGVETDIDCGGGTCGACAVGKACINDTDCVSNACNFVSHLCMSSQCTDQQKDGAETDVDCGGGTCAACSLGLKCQVNTDCSSNACDAASFTCVNSQCSDHKQDGTETDIDCGGSNSCNRCNVGQMCQVSNDCNPGHVCSSGRCQ
jgi:hypothetical protein